MVTRSTLSANSMHPSQRNLPFDTWTKVPVPSAPPHNQRSSDLKSMRLLLSNINALLDLRGGARGRSCLRPGSMLRTLLCPHLYDENKLHHLQSFIGQGHTGVLIGAPDRPRQLVHWAYQAHLLALKEQQLLQVHREFRPEHVSRAPVATQGLLGCFTWVRFSPKSPSNGGARSRGSRRAAASTSGPSAAASPGQLQPQCCALTQQRSCAVGLSIAPPAPGHR